jgi:murein DD-endopeptidase MepM/ murein hydrolase activator NlpD
MRATRLSTFTVGFVLASIAGTIVHLNSASAATPARVQPDLPHLAATAAPPVASASPTPGCPPGASMTLAIAFTSNVRDTSGLHLHQPWGKPGDAEGRMVEDYGAYNGDSIREELPVHDVTSGSLQELSGHNAIDIVLDSGTPLYAVTSGTVYTVDNWTIPGAPRGYAAILVSNTLHDDSGDPIAFLYGHVREFDTANGQVVDAGALVAKSGGDADDPGRGFSDMPNVHFEVIESAYPLRAHAGTVNPHQFLENLYAYAARLAPSCQTLP